MSEGTVMFVKPKHFKFLNPYICTEYIEEKDCFIIGIYGEAFAKLVELDLKNMDAIFSDNHFDLSKGTTKKVIIKKDNLSNQLSLDELKGEITVRSVFDIY